MKTNGEFVTGGAIIGTTTNYEALAIIYAGYVGLMQAQGVSLYAFSPQNEPDMSKQYPSATWTPKQIHDFVPYMHEALQSAGLADTKIMIAEESTWGAFGYAQFAMNDPEVASQVGVVAAHNYDGRNPTGQPKLSNVTTQHVWQTEVSTFERYDGSIDNALRWAERIHFFLSEARVSAFHYWYLSGAPNHRTDNEALTDRNGNVALRAYAIGQWSKFVRPGWHEVDVANGTSALLTAFQNEDGSKSAIVAVNPHKSPARVKITVGSGIQGAATPWITSRTQSLIRLADVQVTDGMIGFELPTQSIVTLVGGSKTP
jgi:glucuronoarabinoxylan endo-1,4-beta-xylanase